MKFKLKSHKKENDRLILTIEQSQLFGLNKTEIICTDSNKIYSYNGQSVWFILKPKFKRIDGGTNLLEFCIECRNKIAAENKSNIN